MYCETEIKIIYFYNQHLIYRQQGEFDDNKCMSVLSHAKGKLKSSSYRKHCVHI